MHMAKSIVVRWARTLAAAMSLSLEGRGCAKSCAAHAELSMESHRYIDKVCACLQAKAAENDWAFTDGPEHIAFPLPNVSIFDVPTWTSVTDFQVWEGRKGTPELPNFKYYNSQLNRLLHAVCKRSSSEAA
eukprot:symbB.v1.2.002416.t1/scaffold129.1/size311234/5